MVRDRSIGRIIPAYRVTVSLAHVNVTPMSDDLYERDLLLWSEHQVGLLRRVAAGERVNGIDWDRVIEEIGDVGGSQLIAVQSLLRQAMIHLIKLHLSPRDTARAHWHDEIEAFTGAAEDRYAPSMAQRLDLQRAWTRAKARVEKLFPDDPAVAALPAQCPWSVQALLNDSHSTLVSTLAKPRGTP